MSHGDMTETLPVGEVWTVKDPGPDPCELPMWADEYDRREEDNR